MIIRAYICYKYKIVSINNFCIWVLKTCVCHILIVKIHLSMFMFTNRYGGPRKKLRLQNAGGMSSMVILEWQNRQFDPSILLRGLNLSVNF